MKTFKKTLCLLLLASFVCFSAADANAWGELGHATVGQIAQDHLTPKAKKALKEYLGYPLSFFASDADAYRSVWTLDLGFVPTNPEASRVSFLKDFDFTTPLNISPWSHSVTVDMNFKCFPTDNLDGAYINNAAYYIDRLSKQLKEDAENMDPFERYKAIAIIVHLMGDMHCPMHIVYLPDNPVKGHYFVELNGKKHDMHVLWDARIFKAYYNWSFKDMAYLVDTATKKEIAEITKGDVYKYAENSARDSWPVVSAYKDGDVLPSSYATDIRPILFSQLRNGGYRLAAILNEIFK